jgi:hypothetical protein
MPDVLQKLSSLKTLLFPPTSPTADGTPVCRFRFSRRRTFNRRDLFLGHHANPMTTATGFTALATRLRYVILNGRGEATDLLERGLVDALESLNETQLHWLTELERLLLEAVAQGLNRNDLLDKLAVRGLSAGFVSQQKSLDV